MSASPKSVLDHHSAPTTTETVIHQAFLRFLPAVESHAKVQFRRLPADQREEAIAEATAAAYLNVHQSVQNGTAENLTPSTVATFAVLHVRDGRHVGGGRDRAKDVMSPRAQARFGFQVYHVPWSRPHSYDCMRDPTTCVWRDRLQEDRRANVGDLAALRLDLSEFLRQQHDRTRQMLAMLAAGYRQVDVAERFGVTPAAVCQRVKRAECEWLTWQGDDTRNAKPQSKEDSNRSGKTDASARRPNDPRVRHPRTRTLKK